MPGAVAGRLRKEIIELGYGSVEYWTYRRLVDEAGADPLTTFGGISSFFYILLKPRSPSPGSRAACGARRPSAPASCGASRRHRSSGASTRPSCGTSTSCAA